MNKTFTILHTNDMHAAFIGMGPASDYTPFTLKDDATKGGYARLAALIAKRTEARKNQGPVQLLDAGDFSMGTAFTAASREIGGELQIMSRMGYDALDISGADECLYSLTCPFYVGLNLVAIPQHSKGKLSLVPKNKDGQTLTSKIEALDDLRSSTAQMMGP